MVREILGYEYQGAHFMPDELAMMEQFIADDREEEAERRGRAGVRSYLVRYACHYQAGEYVPRNHSGAIGNWRKVANGQTFTRWETARVFVWR